MSAYLILEVSSSPSWTRHHSSLDNLVIPPGRLCSVLQGQGRKAAEEEVLRLALVHPTCQFVLFEAVATGVIVEVPTHVTLGGKVMAVERHARLADVDDVQPF